MFNVMSHQGNTNQSYKWGAITPQLGLLLSKQTRKQTGKDGEKSNLYILLVEM
jgi:hypothetical protein